MRKSILIMLLAVLTMTAAAQETDKSEKRNDSPKQERIQLRPDQMPSFPGGQKALMKYLSRYVQYPQLAARYGVEGRVVMRFVVDVDGSLKDIAVQECQLTNFEATKFRLETDTRQDELKRMFAALFVKEGARVIRQMPKWKPGEIDGKAIRVRHTIPITFALTGR